MEAVMTKQGYYDGHYVDSGLSPDEREKILREAEQEDEKLTEWPTEN